MISRRSGITPTWIVWIASAWFAFGSALLSAEPELPWSFHPVQAPAIPTSQRPSDPLAPNPVDAFIGERLAQAHLRPNPTASRRVLLRRLNLDLVGLPPSMEEIAAFEADPRPGAWDRQIDRLLARPEYGERWARHWLDVVRFAQSNGYERDGEKLFAWRYRDYVVRSLNADKPYDQFVREHIAGDELVPWSEDAIIATGYARLGVLDDEPDDPEQAMFDELDDILSTTGVAFLGLTLGCARCHEHKFDPISHADYYRLLAFFRGVEPARHVSELGTSTAHISLADPAALQAWNEQHALQVRKLEQELQSAKEPGEKKRVERQLANLRKVVPPFEQALALRESVGETKPTHVLKRGNPRLPAETVHPGVLSAVESHHIAKDSPLIQPDQGKSRGRRRVLADWIASSENPWTARVIVNRVWQHHFGVGLVRSSGDFGRAGTPPTHPELLDWLASELVAHGWSLKWLHRQILSSDAYQRNSDTIQHSGQPAVSALKSGAEVDPSNALMWRQNLRRLDAESIRDSVLAISGTLNQIPGGRGFFPMLSGEVLEGGSRPGTDWEISSEAEQSRRSLYAYIRRTQAIPFFETLDYANYTSPLTERPVTTVAPQALLLLNDDFMQAQARTFSRRILKELRSEPLRKDPPHAGFIRRGYQIALGRNPTTEESRIGELYIERQGTNFSKLDTRMRFRSRVPGTMNTSYFNQLKRFDFMSAPTGWLPFRGSWPDSYEGNQIMRRGAGPFALWKDELPPAYRLAVQLIPHTAFENGGLLLAGDSMGDAFVGFELSLDLREQQLRLLRFETNSATQLASTDVRLEAGQPLNLNLDVRAGHLKVWLKGESAPRFDQAIPQRPNANRLGIRTWGSALSVDGLTIEGPSFPTGQAVFKDPDNDPHSRALESYCLLLLNLNELLYVD